LIAFSVRLNAEMKGYDIRRRRIVSHRIPNLTQPGDIK
jgi:hypothetical protein